MRTYIARYLLFLFLVSNSISAVSLVYNLRVRRIFNIPAVLERIQSRTIFSIVPIFFRRTSDIETSAHTLIKERRSAGGALLNMRYIPSKHGWIEVTTGVEKDSGVFEGEGEGLNAARAGLDDLVLSGGYRHFLNNWQAVGYGLIGLPTRRKVTLCDRYTPLVGTRFYNVGIGGEVSYSIISELKRSVAMILQARFIHGFNRKWFPILPKEDRIQPGNSSDLLFSVQWREKRTVFEAGYDATFFSNQAIITPQTTITTDTFVRHSWFASVARGVEDGFFDRPTIFGAGFNVNTSRKFNAKAYVLWVYLTQVF